MPNGYKRYLERPHNTSLYLAALGSKANMKHAAAAKTVTRASHHPKRRVQRQLAIQSQLPTMALGDE
jgi:hypothetical protein